MRCSVDPIGVGCSVHHLEGNSSALVEDTLGAEALVLVISVGGHASTESVEVLRGTASGGYLGEGNPHLLWRSCKESISKSAEAYMMTRSSVRVDFLEVPPKLWTMFSIGICAEGSL